MVRVTIKSAKYDRIEFEFVDCEVAGEFMEVAMNAAVGDVTFEVEKVIVPAEESQGEPERRRKNHGSLNLRMKCFRRWH